MSRTGYRLRLLLGRACYMAVIYLPWGARLPSWFLAWAGFYANDDGYKAHIARVRQNAKDPAP